MIVLLIREFRIERMPGFRLRHRPGNPDGLGSCEATLVKCPGESGTGLLIDPGILSDPCSQEGATLGNAATRIIFSGVISSSLASNAV
jgi:hypothetical protein